MININTLKELVEFVANKHQSGGTMTPIQYNLCVGSALDDIILYYYGLPQHYAPGNPLPAVAWQETQLISDYLAQLKPTVNLVVDAQGHATRPADYIHKSSLSYDYIQPQTGASCEDDKPIANPLEEQTVQTTVAKAAAASVAPTIKKKPITVLTDEQFVTALNSQVRQPSRKYPVCRFMDTYIEFAPKNLGVVEMTYIRYPKTPVWAYTNPSGYDAVYNPALSVDLELPAILLNQVAYSILTKLGINIREAQLQQFAEMLKKSGV